MKKIIIVFALILFATSAKAENEFRIDAPMMYDGGFSFDDAVKSFSEGKTVVRADELWQEVWSYLFKELRENARVMLAVFGLCVLYALLGSLEAGFGKKTVSETAFFALYATLIGLCVTAFRDISLLGTNLADNLAIIQNAVVPIMGTAIVSSGGIGVYSAMAPVILLTSNAAGNIIKYIGIPGVFLSLAVSIAGNISPNFPMRGLSRLIRRVSLFVVTGATTVFCALVGISGMGSGALNAAAVKSLRFAVSSAVPVLGSILSDSVEAVASGAAILKNAVGAAGIAFILLTVLFPVLKMAAVVIIYRLAGAFSGIFTDRRIPNVLGDLASSLSCIIGFCISMAACLTVSLSILISASNMGTVT